MPKVKRNNGGSSAIPLGVEEKKLKTKAVKKTPNDYRSVGDKSMYDLYKTDISSLPLLTRLEEIDLAEKINRGDKEAKEKLITANLRLVISVAKKYIGFNVDFLDLIQEGNLGLIKAAEKYNADYGFKFSTYGIWWIKQYINMSIYNNSKSIRVPAYKQMKINKIKKAERKLESKFNRLPTTKELAEELELEEEVIKNLLSIPFTITSLDKTISEEDDETLANFIVDDKTKGPEETAELSILKEMIEGIIEDADLSPREKTIIKKRFGIKPYYRHTLQQIGNEYGVTRERIRQIEARVLNKLREIVSHDMKDFIGG